jgi:hypothetical protein
MHWDGFMYGANGRGYSNTNRKSIDFVQQVAFLAGYKANISIAQDNRKDSFNTCYKVHISQVEHITTQKIEKTVEHFEGKVYCVTVPSGNIVVRSNNKVMATGNCSMIRSDMIDLVDQRLKQIKGNGKPFGGVQMVFVGDFFQLSPIVAYREKKLFNSKYDSPYCFNSKSWKQLKPEIVMLTEVMRQDDAKQIALLNSVRTKDKHYVRAIKVINEISSQTRLADAVTLCSLKKDVETINNYRYSQKEGKEYSYRAYSKGKFAKGDQPVPETLKFKEGVQVVIVANNPEEGFYNGEQGVIIAISVLDVTVRKSNGEEVIVEPFEWKKTDFEMVGGSLKRVEVGSYTQIPLLLGYAISTHRAQGMTLPEYNLDLGSRGAFAHGQAYVALSRAKDLTKVHLSLPLKQRDIIVDQEVLDFYEAL